MGNKMFTLEVMMWFHYTVRKRTVVVGLIEFIVAVAPFVTMFAFKNQLNPVPVRPTGLVFNNIQLPEPLELSRAELPQLILYTPYNPFTKTIMESVGRKLNIPQLKTFPTPGTHLKGYYPYNDTSEIMSYVMSDDMKRNDALVIFEDVVAEKTPSSLNYTIRMKAPFRTETTAPADGLMVPHQSFGTIYEPFLQLQWAIDTSYLELRTGADITQRVTLQEFPYVDNTNDMAMELFVLILNMVIQSSMSFIFINFVMRLMEERLTGVQMLLKMAGVRPTTMCLSHLTNAIMMLLLVTSFNAPILTSGKNIQLLPKSNRFLVYMILLLNGCSVLSFGYFASYIVTNVQFALGVAVLFIMFLGLPYIAGKYIFKGMSPLFCGMFPYGPLDWFSMEVYTLEKYGTGLTFETMLEPHTKVSGSVLMAMIFMVLQTLLFLALSWYMEHVRPGPFGQAKPWYFLFKRRKNDVDPDMDEQEESMTADMRYFEPTSHEDVGIQIKNITKVYPKHRALHNVSLDVHRGEITVLLGHNGAGKTTLMSIITGMVSPTSGAVVTGSGRLGFCPQTHIFHKALTVLDHAVLFTLLRSNLRVRQAEKSSKELLKTLGIGDKANSKSTELSGGMKRRMQLACALAGDADVLILDEPTSGLDVETRRELWDLLLSLRGNRTVVLSTHFMEEADALGDRVAALHAGTLRCYASPLYLKKAIGTGYRLTLTTIGQPNEVAISNVVKSSVNDAALKESSINSVSYNLPSAATVTFPALFSNLESKRSQLGIDSIGVGASTLEEVFLLLCSDTTISLTQDEIDGISGNAPAHNRLTGAKYWCRNIYVLLRRQVNFLLHKKWLFLCVQVLMPIVINAMFFFNSMKPEAGSKNATSLALEPEMYGDPSRVLVGAGLASLVPYLTTKHPDVHFQLENNHEDFILRMGKEDTLTYNKYMAAIDMNDTDVKVMYPTTIRHAAGVALALTAQALAAKLGPGPGPEVPALEARNYPLTSDDAPALTEPRDAIGTGMLFVIATIVILSSQAIAASLPSMETFNSSRHIHIMAGCSPELYWTVALVFQAIKGLVTLILPLVIICAFDPDKTLNEPYYLMALAVVMLLGCTAFFAMIFLMSFSPANLNCRIITCLMLSIGVGLAQGYYEMKKDTGIVGHTLGGLEYVLPPQALVRSLLSTQAAASKNAMCALNRDMCSRLAGIEDFAKCCASEGNIHCFFCFETERAASSMIILALQTIFYMGLVFAAQRGVFSFLKEKICNLNYKRPVAIQEDDIVRGERTYVNKAIALPTRQIQDTMLASDLHKNYRTFLCKSFNALKGASFSIKKGECFGLLGVNGAGKTSTFRLLTAEDWATRGHIYANGQRRQGFSNHYMRTMGYCPQYFGLDEFQTGRSNLEMLLTFKGLDDRDVKAEAMSWIKVVGLEKYSERAVSGYSGGCQRRLAAAAALAVARPLALLDEPTAGVDVAARRRVWAALRRGLANKRAVVVTSHSMDEMEALCDRIAILCGGRVCALGSPAALRAAHAAGHAARLKLRPPRPGAKEDVDLRNQLKAAMQQKFNCTIKDEHKTMIHYHINETLPYSSIFEEMENLRKTFSALVEDYAVSETTLEEVFLSFAKPPEEGTPVMPRPV